MDMFKMIEVIGNIEDALGELDNVNALGAVLGMSLDIWTANKSKSYEEVHEMLERLVTAHKDVNAEFGMMEV